MSQRTADLVVCGGGVVGLSIAWLASREGWKVDILDARAIGRGASWAGAGILPSVQVAVSEDPLEQLRSRSHYLHAAWGKELKEVTRIDNGFRTCGGVYLGRSIGEVATLRAQQSWWDEFEVPYESLSCKELEDRWPVLRSAKPNVVRGWFLPNECQLRNPHHLQALRSACEQNGVSFHEHAPVEEWVQCNDRLSGARTPEGTFSADRYCITAGAWSSGLLKSLQQETGIMPVRGQMLLYKLDRPMWSPVINEGHRYLVPRDDGHVLAGSCEEEVGFDESTTEEMLSQLHSWATSLVPELTLERRVRTWAGLRPGSFDALPYLGKIPGLENAFVASGHFRHGLHLSPATAEVMMELMSGAQPSIDLRPFRLTRGHAFADS